MSHTLSTTPRRHVRVALIACAVAGTIASFATDLHAQYEAPATYYSSITNQTGSTLKSQLTSIMSSGHVQTDYDDARDFLPFTDAVPGDATKMYEYYTRVVINKSVNEVGFVGIYNSREHVWPDSQQGSGGTSGGTKGSRGDIHMLKPLSSSVNGTRGNLEFGTATSTGVARTIGSSYWYPGDFDRGDTARIAFYADTRWDSTLNLVDGLPSANNEMGDKQALLRYHYLDVPDLFERRRNDTIYRGDDVRTTNDDSSWSGTKNRNAYIDRPEYVWSVFVDQQNDSRLTIANADSTDANAGSTKTFNLGRVLRNAPVPSSTQTITINKDGVDGTYYSVTTAGLATSNVTGAYNAFAMDTTGSRQITVGLTATTTTPGLQSGSVTINNLDVTKQGGVGRGANDANDVVNLQLAVLAPSNGSFAAASDVNSLEIDLGTLAQAADGSRSRGGTITNLASIYGAAYTAGLDLDGVLSSGDTSALSLNLSNFTALAAGGANPFTVSLAGDELGTFDATYTLNVSDENLPGTQLTSQLTLTLRGRVALGGDADYSNSVDFDDLLAVAQNYGSAATAWTAGNFNDDSAVDFDDLLVLAANYGTSAASLDALPASFAADFALAQALVPEPTVLLGALSLGLVNRRRRRRA